MSDWHEDEVKEWGLAYCRECGKPFPAVEAWMRECLPCFKEKKGYSLTKGDKQFVWSQHEIMRLREALDSARDEMARNNRATPQSLRAEPIAITPRFIRDILSLTHPDKHKNSERATRITQALIALRTELKERE
jgi:hypothetical protein